MGVIFSNYLTSLMGQEEEDFKGDGTLYLSEKAQLYHGSCFDYFTRLDDKSFDVVFGDIPYQMLDASWDKKGSFDTAKYMDEIFRIAKDDAPIILTCCSKLAFKLISLKAKWFNHQLIWVKPCSTNPMLARYRPAPRHESVLIFYKKQPKIYGKLKNYYHAKYEGIPKPQDDAPESMEALDAFIEENTRLKLGGCVTGNRKEGQEYCMEVKKYKNRGWAYHTKLPTDVIEGIKIERSKLNPTHKPVALMKRLLKYYVTKESIVGDFTFGSGATIDACKLLGCYFKGSEMDEKQWTHACNKIRN